MKVYGSRVSYYTGKLEAYLRYRGHDYTLLPTYGHTREILAGAGTTQMPAVRLGDGRWMSDSTPIIGWLERDAAAPSIYPADPALGFLAFLIEDYADEWLWRPAMHYRWSYRLDREHISGLLADEQGAHRRAPRFLKRRGVARRQLHGFVLGDGVTDATRAHVEQGYLRALDALEAIFAERPFVLGGRPTIADFGLMGPMLRHFGQDPTPEEIMRTRAPGVYEWVARMWNARADGVDASLVEPGDARLHPLLTEAAETHLDQLRQNAQAFADDATRFAQTIQGQRYADLPVSRYRVWCLERLQAAARGLEAADAERVRAVLPDDAVSLLFEVDPPRASEYDVAGEAPFNRAINVYGDGVPR